MATFYISSTFEDLKEYRQAAIEAVRRSEHEVGAMEDWSAADTRPLANALADVEHCDACIFIVGFRYGYVPGDSDGISVTEAEYRRALELHKPMFAFLVDEKASWPVQFIDTGESAQRIQAFRAAIAGERYAYVQTFKSLEDFTIRLQRAVDDWAFKAGDPVQPVAPPATSTADQWPQDLDLRVLAWHLVADFKSGPDLLRHMDIELLRQAIEKWGGSRTMPTRARAGRSASRRPTRNF